MKITALVENTSVREDLKTVHGLSFYIETDSHKLLFDLGPGEVVVENAEKLGIDLAAVDAVFISHGHNDHGGALDTFLKVNEKAKIYIRKEAFDPYYAKVGENDVLFIGLDPELLETGRFVFTEEAMRIDDELFVFACTEEVFDTQSRRALMRQTADGYEQDDFRHEQNLIIEAGGKMVLLAGCAHSGICGIVTEAFRYKPGIEAVIGGFHLHNPNTNASESRELVLEVAEKLNEYDAVFYTCHCTGKTAFDWMSEIMNDKLRHVSTGQTIEL